MIERNDPLAGFVLYKNQKEFVKLSVGKDYVRTSADALRMIGNPEYINIFFDEQNQRIAVKSSEKTLPNTFFVTTAYGIAKCSALREKILDVAGIEWYPGEVIRFNGQKCGDDYIIFDLKKAKKSKFDLHLSNMVKTAA